MDQSKYSALRERLTAQRQKEANNRKAILDYIENVVALINQQHMAQRPTCLYGVIRNGIFVEHQVDFEKSEVVCAIRVQFNTDEGIPLLEISIALKASIHRDVLKIESKGDLINARMTVAYSRTDEGKSLLAGMIDAQVEKVVESEIPKTTGFNLDDLDTNIYGKK